MKGTLCVLFTIAAVTAAETGHAREFFITSVIREFPMKSGESSQRDYYINAGTNNGLKQGAFIDAIRKIPAFDNINSKLLGETPVKIARLRVIHVDKDVAIARLVKFYDKDKIPLVGYDAVMIGDHIRVSEKQ